MTLREAAQRTARSITTLRRYIRSGRLRAAKRVGRFGPEYFVSEQDLADAELDTGPSAAGSALPARVNTGAIATTGGSLPARRSNRESVPLTLYQDLQMKHEQLLVQYGMVRAGGLRVMELQSQLDAKRKNHQEATEELGQVREKLRRDTETLERSLREARLELEGRSIEIAALKEKVKGLELVTRNAVTTEAIEKQFSEVMQQSRKVERLSAPREAPAPAAAPWKPGDSADSDAIDH